MAANMNYDSLQAFLKRCCDVAMLVCDLLIWPASYNQLLVKTRPRGLVVLPLVARMVDVQNRYADRSIRLQQNICFEEGAILLGLAVWRESHDLILVGIEVEAQV